MRICVNQRGWWGWLAATAILLGLLTPIASAYSDQQKRVEPTQDAMNERDTLDGKSTWSEFREDLVRCVVETTVTAFLIRTANPPAPPQGSGDPQPTPPGQNNTPPDPPPPPPPPDPPSGSGDPIDPPFDPPPPPSETPEPASIITALMGVGLTSIYAWRRRQQSNKAAE